MEDISDSIGLSEASANLPYFYGIISIMKSFQDKYGKQLISELRKFLSSIIIIASSAIIGLVLLLLVNILSTDVISANMCGMMATEGYAWNPTDTWTLLDGFTDNLMMNIAAFPRQESIVRHTLLAPYADFYGGANMMSHLNDLVNGREITPEYTRYYGRYWHGYLIILKPLLSFEIRTLNMFLIILLLFIAERKIIKSYGMAKGIAFLSVFLIINPLSAMLCMQYASVTYIFLISTLVLLTIREKANGSQDLFLLYLIAGITTSFFDLLTFPLVTLGTLLITELLTEKNTYIDKLVSRLYMVARYSAYWCLGYFGLWGSKHLLTGILTDYDIWLDVKAAAFTRIKGGDFDLSVYNILIQNARVIVRSPVFVFILVLLLICIFIALKENHIRNQSGNAILVSYTVIAIYPIIWYMVLRNHSLTHYNLAFRELSITVYAIVACAITLIERRNRFE